MRIDVFTIFPDLVDSFSAASLLGKARNSGCLDLRCHDIRDGAEGTHRSVDDAPFGGGAGMVIKPEPVFEMVKRNDPPRPLIFLTPSGKRFEQSDAEELSKLEGFSLLCGRYEGVDQRVIDHLVDREISLGDFVLSGGEVAALALIESIVRLIPGVMGNEESPLDESYSSGLLEYPHYTRPREYEGYVTPSVLLSGDHNAVFKWRRAKSLLKTMENRPDMILKRGGLTDEEQSLLKEYSEGAYEDLED